jgi:cytochrome P450
MRSDLQEGVASLSLADLVASLTPATRDPHPVYTRLRHEAPVYFAPSLGTWLVTRRDDAIGVLRDVESFIPDTTGFRAHMFGREDCLTFSTGDQHRRMRKSMHDALYAPNIEERLKHVFVETANALVEQLREKTAADLHQEFMKSLSVRTLREIYGLHQFTDDQLLAWNNGFWSVWATDDDHGVPRYTEGAEAKPTPAVKSLLDEVEPALTSALAESEGSGQPSVFGYMQEGMTASESLQNAKLFLLTLLEPAEAIATTLWYLLRDPNQLAKAKVDQRTMQLAVEEATRLWPLPGIFIRVATRDQRVGRETVRRGERVGIVAAAVNRDEQYWESPDTFDITRRVVGQMTYGHGVHICLGARLVRQLTPIAVQVLIDNLPGLRLRDDDPVSIGWWPALKPQSLHACWGS